MTRMRIQSASSLVRTDIRSALQRVSSLEFDVGHVLKTSITDVFYLYKLHSGFLPSILKCYIVIIAIIVTLSHCYIVIVIISLTLQVLESVYVSLVIYSTSTMAYVSELTLVVVMMMTSGMRYVSP